MTHFILVINPGSTSTKVAVFEDDRMLKENEFRHSPEELSPYDAPQAQKHMRAGYVLSFLTACGFEPRQLSAVAARGGILSPLASGTYFINEAMLTQLKGETAGAHASCLGALIAADIAASACIPAFVVDPVTVDELSPVARLSGIPAISRRSCFHALNARATARQCASEMGLCYEEGRFVVAHLGGGISVSAHLLGCVVDVNDSLKGEGPFTPERSGGLPLTPLMEMCFSGEHSQESILALTRGQGGLIAYLGSSDLKEIGGRIEQGDAFAAQVVDAMGYQIAKEIGAMAAVLEARAHAIVLTGGAAHSQPLVDAIIRRVGHLGPVRVYPGQREMEALAEGVLRVLTGREAAKEYRG